jgi:uncharacterized membrane protein YedE/YeeE
MATFSAFIVGLIFAIGLGIGGMTQPGKVVGFLDIFGEWNPSLIFVMLGALGVHSIFYRLIRKRNTPFFAEKFHIPTRRDINRDLILGATLFGSGWGLAGFCPAPAITSLASLQLGPIVFVVSMLSGMWIFQVTNKTKS